jgi:hypothetical protein
VIVNAEDDTEGLQTYDALSQFIDEKPVVFSDLFCIVSMNMNGQQQLDVYSRVSNNL